MQSIPGGLKASIVNTDSVRYEQGGALHILDHEKLRGLFFRRFFFFNGMEAGQRIGNHAHRTCTQVFVPLSGTSIIALSSPSGTQTRVPMSLGIALIVEPWTWVSLEFLEPTTCVLVAATEIFDDEDYIRDWEEFSNSKNLSD